MKKNILLILAVFLGLNFLLSSCMPGPRVVGTPGVSVSKDKVIVAYGTSVLGIDIQNGSVVWHYPEKASAQRVFYARPLITDDAVYIGDFENSFHKLDLETGTEKWSFTDAKGYFTGQAAIDGGRVYAPSNDGNLYALDQNGDLLWKFSAEHYIWAQPQFSADRIFVGSTDHFVYALSMDGKEIWSREMAGAIVDTPVLSEDGSVLFVGSMGKEMVALDTTAGDILWTFDSNGNLQSVWGSAVLVNNTLIFADSAGKIFGLDPDNGEPVWQTEVAGSVVGGLAAMKDGFVLATKEGQVKAFDAMGTPLWEATLDGEIYNAPALNDEYVVVGAIKGSNLLYAFNTKGVQIWSSTPENKR